MGQSDVISAGSVRFKPAGEHATEVRVKLQYDPPAGKIGATVAWLLGEDPQHQIAEDLRRFKQMVETGEVSAVQDYQPAPSSERVPRARRSRRRLRLGTLTENVPELFRKRSLPKTDPGTRFH